MNLTTSSSGCPAALALVALAAGLAVALPADAGETGGPVVDPKGDVHDPQAGGGPLTDLASIDISHDGETVHFELSFFTPIEPPHEALPNSLGGLIEFDADQDAATGIPASQNQWAPPFELLTVGGEYAIILTSEFQHPGFVKLMGLDVGLIALVPVTYTEFGVSGAFPLAHIDDEDGMFDYASVIGNMFGPNDAVEAVGTSYFQTCAEDLDGDGIVGVGDLTAVILAWGTDAADLTGDGTTDVSDLIAVISAWGLCNPA